MVNSTFRPLYPWERLGTIVQEAGSGRLQEILPPPGFDPRTVHPVASLYPGPYVQLVYLFSAVGHPQSSTFIINRIFSVSCKGKFIPLQARCGPEGG